MALSFAVQQTRHLHPPPLPSPFSRANIRRREIVAPEIVCIRLMQAINPSEKSTRQHSTQPLPPLPPFPQNLRRKKPTVCCTYGRPANTPLSNRNRTGPDRTGHDVTARIKSKDQTRRSETTSKQTGRHKKTEEEKTTTKIAKKQENYDTPDNKKQRNARAPNERGTKV